MSSTPIEIPIVVVESVINELRNKYNIDFTGYNRNFLRRRIASRMNRRGIDSPWAYRHLLINDVEEFSRLLQNLTINTTEFMRNSEVFSYLERKILPQIALNANGDPVFFWSAGCSRGQEPYSLAIILLKLGIPKRIPITIIATDIDEVALAVAKKGVYEKSSLDSISRVDRGIYFHAGNNGEYSIDNSVRKLIRFQKHDVVKGPPLGSFDMIICRNVSIYFMKSFQAEMYRRFCKDLKLGGYLVTGKTEMPPTRFEDAFASVDFENRIYRKARI